MSLFGYEESLERYAERLCELFVAGTKVLNNMFQNRESLTFREWSTRLGQITEVDGMLRTDAQWRWLWDAIRTEPSFKTRFGELPAATVPWTSKGQRFQVFHAGEQFEIGMKGAIVSVRTEEPLDMRRGKGDRLECCDCKAIVTIQVAETYPVEREADIMRIDSKHIKVSKNILTVEVASLNQAYTISSRRLEPERRSHGGRTYDHVVHVTGTKCTLLEDIRREVENGTWKTPFVNDQPNKPAAESASEKMLAKEVNTQDTRLDRTEVLSSENEES